MNVLDAYKKQAQEQELYKKITEYINSDKDFKYFKCDYYKDIFNSIRYKKAEYYNLKKVEYLNSVEYRIYKIPVISGIKQSSSKTEYEEIEGKQYNKQTGEQRTEESINHSAYTSLNRTKQKIYDYALANDWTNGYFFTITFNKEYVDRYSYDECYKRINTFLKILKRNNQNAKYIFVPERHKDGAWHFHGLIVNCDNLLLVDSHKKQKGKTVYNINLRSFKYGFTTATKVQDTNKVSSYITKYITKELIDNTKGKHRYIFSKNLDVPTVSTELLDIDDKELNGMLIENNKNFEYKKVSGGDNSPNTITYYHLKK